MSFSIRLSDEEKSYMDKILPKCSFVLPFLFA